MKCFLTPLFFLFHFCLFSQVSNDPCKSTRDSMQIENSKLVRRNAQLVKENKTLVETNKNLVETNKVLVASSKALKKKVNQLLKGAYKPNRYISIDPD